MKRNTVVRAMHDVGLAAWFGGSLMGAIGLNGAASIVSERSERMRVANTGWERWAPVSTLAVAAHVIGGVGLLMANRQRIAHQAGVGTSTLTKVALTGVALAATAYTGALGARMKQAGEVPVKGAVQPDKDTPEDVAKAQRQLRVLQWVIPATTGTLIVLTSLHGEQQWPGEMLRGIVHNAFSAGSR